MNNSEVPEVTKSAPEKIIKPLAGVESKITKPAPFLIAALILGVFSGVLLFSQTGHTTITLGSGKTATTVSSGTTVGSTNTKDFSDCAQGQLQKNDGKVTSEGSHMLIRPGGVSQTVYLTSSVLDLDQFLGKQVEVCGQTYKGQTAGWLMDVGRVTLK